MSRLGKIGFGARRSGRWIGLGMALLGVLSVAAAAAPPPEARTALAEATLSYSATLVTPNSFLVLDETLHPEYVRFSAGYVAAALMQGKTDDRVLACLKSLLAGQDLTPKSLAHGLFRPDPLTPTPGLAATCQLLPLLSYIYNHGEALPADLRAQVKLSLEAAYAAVSKQPAPPEHPYLDLVRAAALATAGKTLGHPEGLAAANTAVNLWTKRQLQVGCWTGHSATADALRLGALAWIAEAAGQASPNLNAAIRLAYLDLVQRIQPGSEALAGASTFVQPLDYTQGGDLHRYLLFAWGVGPRPTLIRPSAMYFAACTWTPELPAVPADLALPRTVVTVAREGAPVTRTDTYLTPEFSLGTMSGVLGSRAIPLVVTLRNSALRPTAYFFAEPAGSAVSAVQQEGTALMTVHFNQIGAPDRVRAFLQGVLGPRREIEEVCVNGEAWGGEPAAIGQNSVVAVKRDGVYLGVRLGLAGAALLQERHDITKPGILAWQSEDPGAELELYVYARKQTYELQPPQDNLLAGVLVQVVPETAYPSLQAFARQLQTGKLRQTVSTSVERLTTQEDPNTAFLNENKPKTRAQYKLLAHLLLDSTYQPGATPFLHQQVDIAHDQVRATEVQGAAPTVAGPWQSPLLTLPWDAAAAWLTLTGPGR
ncbi:MAG TPA: hypothetical protein VGM19_11680 [Armatimonadota bacterium]|jgi:hypothetical protein